MTAGIENAQQSSAAKIRVATKFVNIARDHYAKRGVQPNIIKLYGAMELAPIMDLADEIVDIVDTGNTLEPTVWSLVSILLTFRRALLLIKPQCALVIQLSPFGVINFSCGVLGYRRGWERCFMTIDIRRLSSCNDDFEAQIVALQAPWKPSTQGLSTRSVRSSRG